MKEPRHVQAPPRAERWVAAFVLALPLAYLLTEHSYTPVFWHYSYTLLAAIAICAAGCAGVLWSYRWPVPRPLATLRTQLVMAGFGLVAALLVAEAALALFDERPDVEPNYLRGYAPDPDTGYVYRPNYEQDVVDLESTTRWRSNSLGLRADRDYGDRPAGVVRVLALGDSFTVNTQVEARDTWPAFLERALVDAFPSAPGFEVVNAGHAGWGTMQMLRWYEKYGLGLKPDVVLVALTPNDLDDNGAEPPGAFTAVDGYLALRGSTVADRRRFEHRQRWYSLPGRIQRSRILALVTAAWSRDPDGPKLAACHERLTPGEARLHTLTEPYLLKLRDVAARQRAAMGIVLVTFREQLGRMAEGYSGALFGERWLRFARDQGIPAIDTYPRLRMHPGEPPLFWRWDNHYTREGSRLTGEAAFDLVKAMLPRTPRSIGASN